MREIVGIGLTTFGVLAIFAGALVRGERWFALLWLGIFVLDAVLMVLSVSKR